MSGTEGGSMGTWEGVLPGEQGWGSQGPKAGFLLGTSVYSCLKIPGREVILGSTLPLLPAPPRMQASLFLSPACCTQLSFLYSRREWPAASLTGLPRSWRAGARPLHVLTRLAGHLEEDGADSSLRVMRLVSALRTSPTSV